LQISKYFLQRTSFNNIRNAQKPFFWKKTVSEHCLALKIAIFKKENIEELTESEKASLADSFFRKLFYSQKNLIQKTSRSILDSENNIVNKDVFFLRECNFLQGSRGFYSKFYYKNLRQAQVVQEANSFLKELLPMYKKKEKTNVISDNLFDDITDFYYKEFFYSKIKEKELVLKKKDTNLASFNIEKNEEEEEDEEDQECFVNPEALEEENFWFLSQYLEFFDNWLTVSVYEEIDLYERIFQLEINKNKQANELRVIKQPFIDQLISFFDYTWVNPSTVLQEKKNKHNLLINYAYFSSLCRPFLVEEKEKEKKEDKDKDKDKDKEEEEEREEGEEVVVVRTGFVLLSCNFCFI